MRRFYVVAGSYVSDDLNNEAIDELELLFSQIELETIQNQGDI